MNTPLNTYSARVPRKNVQKSLIVLALLAAVAGAFYVKQGRGAPDGNQISNAAVNPDSEQAPRSAAEAATPAPRRLPKLVDLGAGKCIPCKMMAPILAELRQEYAGRFDVQFIDVWENPGAGERYGIRVIPTQIFYGASGAELARHEGFISKEDILNKWQALGVTFMTPPDSATAPSS